MTKFDISVVRHGSVSYAISDLTVTNITVDEGDTEIIFPEVFEGKPVTHIGYKEKFSEAEERYHDWHHPAQGMEIVPARYDAEAVTFCIPKSVTRIFIPASVKEVSYRAFAKVDTRRVVEIAPENPYIEVRENGYIGAKR